MRSDDSKAVGGLDENSVKHLEMIQAVITRMASNSFAVKTWAVGLIAAILALAAEKDGSPWLLLIGLLPVAVFWYLDAYYLRQERLYRRLYDAVRTREETIQKAGPFGMSTRTFEAEPDKRILTVAWSPTIRWLYVLLAAVVLVAFTTVLTVMRSVTSAP